MDGSVSGDAMLAALLRLLRESLAQWQFAGAVRIEGDAILVDGDGGALSIGRAPEGMPFRWVVEVGGRRRTAASVNGVLRIVRQTLAPGYLPVSLRIAPLPAVPEAGQGAP